MSDRAFLDLPSVRIDTPRECNVCRVMMPLRWWAAQHRGLIICSNLCYEAAQPPTTDINGRPMTARQIADMAFHVQAEADELEDEAAALRNEAEALRDIAQKLQAKTWASPALPRGAQHIHTPPLIGA